MIKLLFKSAAMMVLTLLISASVAYASGKMEVMIGDIVEITADSKLISPQYKWAVTKGKSIVNSQVGRIFSYLFAEQGEYVVNLTATSGTEIETSKINVMAGDRYVTKKSVSEGGVGSVITGKDGEVIGTIGEGGVVIGPTGETIGKVDEAGSVVTNDGKVISDAQVTENVVFVPMKVALETLPPADSLNQVTLLGDGKVQFQLDQSYGEIIEYRIDKNIYADSNGNGIANDDIDNQSDNSYLTGSGWSADYKKGESSKVVAEVTLVDKQGNKAKKQVEIVFKEQITTGDPKAVLEILPAPDAKDGLVHLYNDPHKVSFYSRVSEGKILEYRIDKNIFEDSNADGDPKNDIDNLKDLSFKTGDVFEAEYAKTDAQIIAQLIVVGEGGKGSRLQKELVFGDKPLPIAPNLSDMEQTGIRLVADKDYVIKGDPIKFSVKGLALDLENYTFGWDFNGDGTIDQTTEGVDNIEYIFDTPGIFNVKVSISDMDENKLDKTLEIIVKDTQVTKADFSSEVNGNTVKFTDLSTISYNLSDKQLQYNWSFGDTDTAGYEKQVDQTTVQNPLYTYNLKGKYLVTLTVTDSDKVVDSKSAEVEILQDLVVPGAVPTETTTESTGGGSIILKVLKVILYLVLIVIALILVLVGGFLVFLKVQHPQLTFEELIEEFKVKILTMIGAADMPPPAKETPSSSPSSRVSDISSAHEETSAEEDEKVIHPPVEPLPVETGPVPDWLKGTEVIEGEAEPVEGPVEGQIEGQMEGQVEEPIEEALSEETQAEETPVQEAPAEENAPIEPVEENALTESTEETRSTESTESEEVNPPAEEEVLSEEPTTESEEGAAVTEDTTPTNQTTTPPVLGPDGLPLRKKRKRHRKRKHPLGAGPNQPNTGGGNPPSQASPGV